MQSGVINVLIEAFLYLLLAGGIFLSAQNSLKSLVLWFKTRRRLYIGNRKEKKTGKLEAHVEVLLSMVLGRKIPADVFLFFNALFLLLVLVFGIRTLPAPLACLIALMMGGMPYLLLRVRLETLRRRGSMEGERLVAALLNQYRIENCNMYETIERVVASGKDYKVCRNLLFRMLLEIRSTGDSGKIQKATERFSKALKTNWGRMLAHNIRVSVEYGMDVSPGIEDILIQLREARVIAEERKRLNGESVRITAFLAPLLYAGSVLLSVRFLGIPLREFVKNQVGTPEGFVLLTFIVFMFLLNIALIELVMNQRLDF
jgi:hypothetical protein